MFFVLLVEVLVAGITWLFVKAPLELNTRLFSAQLSSIGMPGLSSKAKSEA